MGIRVANIHFCIFSILNPPYYECRYWLYYLLLSSIANPTEDHLVAIFDIIRGQMIYSALGLCKDILIR